MLRALLKRILKKKPKADSAIFGKGINIGVSPDFRIGQYRNIQILDTSSVVNIGNNVCFREFCNILVYNSAKLSIAQNVFFNNYCSVNCLGEISIGENTLFGEGVKMYDHNHKYSKDANNQLVVAGNEFNIGKIKIGRNCWIGSNVTILNNVEIGDNTIIGANNLIYKSVPPNSVVKLNAQADIKEI